MARNMVLKSPDSFELSCVTQNQVLSSLSSTNIVAVEFLEAFKLYNLLSKLFPRGKHLVSCVLYVRSVLIYKEGVLNEVSL